MRAAANAVRRCSWLCMTLIASTIYVALRWVKARRAEVDAGMAPGIGLGGIHLVRPQQSPMTHPLAHRRLGDRPPDVVLLHGLGASSAIWQPVAEQLAARGHNILLPDLLGFGKSRRLGTTFALADHVDALRRLLQHTEAQQPLLVGHSFGCAVAAALADNQPDTIRALVLVSPPAFRDADIARSRLSERGWLARQFIRGTPAASLVCQTMCLTRPLLAQLAPRLGHDVPDAVARDSVEHTWPAYRDALSALLEDNPLPDAIDKPRRPTLIILGDNDSQARPEDVLAHPHEHIRVEVWPSDHLLPLRHADRLANLLHAELLSPSRSLPTAASTRPN